MAAGDHRLDGEKHPFRFLGDLVDDQVQAQDQMEDENVRIQQDTNETMNGPYKGIVVQSLDPGPQCPLFRFPAFSHCARGCHFW
jgi:hypothetical protein